MKFLFFLLLSMGAFAQQSVSCSKSTLLYSRELFPGAVTMKRAIALSGFDEQCSQPAQSKLVTPQILVNPTNTYQYYPIDANPQDCNGRDIFLGVVTELLVNHLIFDRK